MRETTSKHKPGGGSAVAVAELPDLITACPKCGGEIELWSGEDETVCVFCGHRLFDREQTTH